MLEKKINEKKEITRRDFLGAGTSLISGSILTAAFIYLYETKEKKRS